MSECRIPVDLLNPGQVFACLGLMELSERLAGPAEGEFVYSGSETAANFRFHVDGATDPLRTSLEFLRDADARAIAPMDSGLVAKEPGVLTDERRDSVFPARQPNTPSALPIRLQRDDDAFVVDHWADGSNRDNVKFWAGAGGYSGAALWRDALQLIRALDVEKWKAACEAPFAVEAPMSSSFRFDWRRDYVPLDLGFSLNEHSTIQSTGYPFVELLAAIGMQFARPRRVNRGDKLNYRYGVWATPLPPVLARPILGAAALAFPTRTFHMRLDWPGKENQARCIVDVIEE